MIFSDCCGSPTEETNIGRPYAEAKEIYKCLKCGKEGAVYLNKCRHNSRKKITVQNDNSKDVELDVCGDCGEII